MQQVVRGTFHFHSKYSHDGRSTLNEIASALRSRGFSFCIMTEHFEDFDREKFKRYIDEVDALNRSGDFLFIPGVEVNLTGLDTILFPARNFEACVQFASTGKDGDKSMFKVLAHASKYSFADTLRHLQTYDIDGIELWNQQADGRYLPPFALLKAFQSHPRRNEFCYLFGCDLHDADLAVSNVITLQKPIDWTPEALMRQIIQKDFVVSNLCTGVDYVNGPSKGQFDRWLDGALKRSYARGKCLAVARRLMKAFYKMLPRRAQHSINDFKNFVRNHV
jgi:PHP domain-containing protein